MAVIHLRLPNLSLIKSWKHSGSIGRNSLIDSNLLPLGTDLT